MKKIKNEVFFSILECRLGKDYFFGYELYKLYDQFEIDFSFLLKNNVHSSTSKIQQNEDRALVQISSSSSLNQKSNQEKCCCFDYIPDFISIGKYMGLKRKH